MKTADEHAHKYATRKEKTAPTAWDHDENDFCGQYWWGLYEGYKAGLRRGKQLARDHNSLTEQG